MGCDELDTGDYFIITLKVGTIIILSSIGIRSYESKNCPVEWSVAPIVSAGLLMVSLILFMVYELCFVRRYGFLTFWQMLLVISIITSANFTNINNSFTSTCDLDNEINTSGILIPFILGTILIIFSLKSFEHYKRVIKLIELKKKSVAGNTNEPNSNALKSIRRSDNIENNWRNDTNKLKL